MALADIIAANIERLGKAKGFTHQKNGRTELSGPKLAKATRQKVSTSTINYVRKLTVSPNIETIEHLAEALQVPPWVLLIDPSDAVGQLLDLYSASTDEDRKHILLLVQSAVSLKHAHN